MAFLETTVKTTRCESTNTGAVDADFCNSKTGKGDLSYWITADRFEIMQNANTAAVRKFKTEFPHLNESTVREFKKNIISRSRTL